MWAEHNRQLLACVRVMASQRVERRRDHPRRAAGSQAQEPEHGRHQHGPVRRLPRCVHPSPLRHPRPQAHPLLRTEGREGGRLISATSARRGRRGRGVRKEGSKTGRNVCFSCPYFCPTGFEKRRAEERGGKEAGGGGRGQVWEREAGEGGSGEGDGGWAGRGGGTRQ